MLLVNQSIEELQDLNKLEIKKDEKSFSSLTSSSIDSVSEENINIQQGNTPFNSERVAKVFKAISYDAD